jgi:aspartyl/asparaginyl beta-hydroxylase (cupin superfamily)
MDINEKRQFINNLIAHSDEIQEEYLGFNRRHVPLTGWDEEKSVVEGWSGIALWWDYRAWPSSQRRCPISTELVREGPDHRATGWLVLQPRSRTPEHNHKEWGHKIICHLPSVLPEGKSGFVVEGKEYNWKMGELFAFDATKDHYGYNDTDEERSIFVLDFDYAEWYDVLKDYMV